MIITALMLATAQMSTKPLVVAAQASTPTAAAPRPATPEQAKALLQRAGMSPAGIARLTQERPQLRTDMQAASQNINQVNAQLRQAMAADPADVNQIASLLRKRDDIVAGVARVRTNETVGALQDLSPADRAVYLRLLIGQGTAAAARTATPPKK